MKPRRAFIRRMTRISNQPFMWNLFFKSFIAQLSDFERKKPFKLLTISIISSNLAWFLMSLEVRNCMSCITLCSATVGLLLWSRLEYEIRFHAHGLLRVMLHEDDPMSKTSVRPPCYTIGRPLLLH